MKTRLSDAPSIRFSFYHGLLINNLVELDSPLVAVTLAAPGNLENPGIETLFSIVAFYLKIYPYSVLTNLIFLCSKENCIAHHG